MNNTPNYYAIIPASVRYDKKLTANAKLLYGEITALTKVEGYCWATNSYFSDLYKVTERSISEWISSLEQQGHIVINIVNGGRRILLGGIEENFQGGWKKTSTLNGEKHQNNLSTEPQKTRQSSPNNTYNNTYIRKSDFLRKKSDSISIHHEGGENYKEEEFIRTDAEGNELPPKKVTPRNSAESELIKRVLMRFLELCHKNLSTKPVFNISDKKMVKFALSTGGLNEKQIYDLFDDWFQRSDKKDDQLINIRQALSTYNINYYKVTYNIK